MKIKRMMGRLLNKSLTFKTVNYRRKIQKQHKMNEKRYIKDASKPIYYVIGFDDPQLSGWTVWERVVLYGSIYAEDHNMIPVVDMKNHKSIYQKAEEYGKINIWDKYYFQPTGVSLEYAKTSGNYVLADTSTEWFNYIRMRNHRRINTEYLRIKYQQFIRLQPSVIETCENILKELIPDYNENTRIFAVKVRGTDYIKYQHSVQPDVAELANISNEKFDEYKCDYIFLSTEDAVLLDGLKRNIHTDKIICFNAGNAANVEGFVGEYMSNVMGVDKAAIDYIATLYILNKSCCLLGGRCGATIVAEYRRNPAYEYFNIIDSGEHY